MEFSCIGNDCVEFAVVNCKYYTYVFDGVGYEDVGSDRFTKGDIRILNNTY